MEPPRFARLLNGLVSPLIRIMCGVLSHSKVEIAFQEAGADVARYQIDLQNKPEWYASRVNPASKVRHSSLKLAFISNR